MRDQTLVYNNTKGQSVNNYTNRITILIFVGVAIQRIEPNPYFDTGYTNNSNNNAKLTITTHTYTNTTRKTNSNFLFNIFDYAITQIHEIVTEDDTRGTTHKCSIDSKAKDDSAWD